LKSIKPNEARLEGALGGTPEKNFCGDRPFADGVRLRCWQVVRRSDGFDRQMLRDRVSAGTIVEENASWIDIPPGTLAGVTKLEAAYCPSKSMLVICAPALAIDISAGL